LTELVAENLLVLDADLGAKAAPKLQAALLERRGHPVVIDGSKVGHIGGGCLQLLLSAKLTWEKELESQTAELQALQTTLEARWQEIQGASDQDIKHLAGMYSAMKPDAAASIFNHMDPAFAAGFLRLIPSEQAGLILANMDSKKAYVISVKLATMNADVRNAPASLNDG